ncbi:hypothetical protein XYCOK13_24250 [Xylanibacillus composti]|uniref:Uncharacterized protein n=1 Tax=Xylanibacillus composti TaxID=1572762 RepID=A0A8J4H500_9BACL|nr:hypothetical protein [Xylanibacillus composti]GIQ69601.1 hypothetical protein XYCOK13_24250 [Xylanibacillus composti]
MFKRWLEKLLHSKSSQRYRSKPYHRYASSDDYKKRSAYGHRPHHQYGQSYYKKRKYSSSFSS